MSWSPLALSHLLRSPSGTVTTQYACVCEHVYVNVCVLFCMCSMCAHLFTQIRLHTCNTIMSVRTDIRTILLVYHILVWKVWHFYITWYQYASTCQCAKYIIDNIEIPNFIRWKKLERNYHCYNWLINILCIVYCILCLLCLLCCFHSGVLQDMVSRGESAQVALHLCTYSFMTQHLLAVSKKTDKALHLATDRGNKHCLYVTMFMGLLQAVFMFSWHTTFSW